MPRNSPNCCAMDRFRRSTTATWSANVEGNGAQLFDHQQGSRARDLMRDINPHLAFSVSFLTSPKKHPLYARPWKQWRLARGEEEGKDVKK